MTFQCFTDQFKFNLCIEIQLHFRLYACDSVLHSSFSIRLNGVYVNTQLQNTCTKRKAQHIKHRWCSVDNDTDTDAADADDDDDDNDILFFLMQKFSLSLLCREESEHMQAYHSIENLYWNICQTRLSDIKISKILQA